MPRPKPPQATKVKTISVRWTQDDHIAYLRLGGSKWLRGIVRAEKNKRMEQLAETAQNMKGKT